MKKRDKIMNLEHIRYTPLLACWKAIEQMDLAYFHSVQLPEEIRVTENILYGIDPVDQLLDIAYPAVKMNYYPLIVQVHGGGWVYGNKDTIYKAYGMALAQKGFAVLTINYHLAPTHNFPIQLYDVDKVLRFIENNAKQYSLDPDNVFMIGDSAGAHLISSYLAIRNSRLPNPFKFEALIDVKAVALSCGVYDFDTFNTPKIKFPQKTNTLRSLFGVSDYKNHPMYPWSLPSKLIESSFPDTLIISSEFDPLYPQSQQFIERLKQENIEFEPFIAHRKLRLPHVFNTRLSYEQSVEALNKISDFFIKRIQL
jgi:acetyl esterase/lipase